MDRLSTYLFARPSALEGVARLLDLAGNLDIYNSCPTPEEADAWAMISDWLATGRDLSKAVRVCPPETGE
jgi:hypothetical protein